MRSSNAEVLSLRVLARLRLVSSTPLLLGGYDTYTRRSIRGVGITEPLRTQSLKGLIRWWSRTLIAGALSRQGSRRDFLRRVASYSGLVWGSAEKGTSSLMLRVVGEELSSCPNRVWNRLFREHQRLRLLSIGRRFLHKDSYCSMAKGDVILATRAGYEVDSAVVSFAIYSLMLSLLLGCLGKGSRRGLGCFDIRGVELSPHYRRILQGLPDRVVDLIRDALDAARDIMRSGSKGPSSGMLPPIPSIAPGVFRLFVCRDVDDPVDLSIKFSRCVTRQYRRLRGSDPLRQRLLAWILGLPRQQRGTGYRAQVDRRASPIILSSHRGYAFISAFYSGDWPNNLRWVGGYVEQRRISDDVITDAMNVAIDFILDCLASTNNIIGGTAYSCSEVRIR